MGSDIERSDYGGNVIQNNVLKIAKLKGIYCKKYIPFFRKKRVLQLIKCKKYIKISYKMKKGKREIEMKNIDMWIAVMVAFIVGICAYQIAVKFSLFQLILG